MIESPVASLPTNFSSLRTQWNRASLSTKFRSTLTVRVYLKCLSRRGTALRAHQTCDSTVTDLGGDDFGVSPTAHWNRPHRGFYIDSARSDLVHVALSRLRPLSARRCGRGIGYGLNQRVPTFKGERRESAAGHERRFDDVGLWSGKPSFADLGLKEAVGSDGPIRDIRSESGAD